MEGMFKFSIRDVLWLTLVVGLAAGWLVDRRSLTTAYQRDLEEMRESHDKDIAELREWFRSELGIVNDPLGAFTFPDGKP